LVKNEHTFFSKIELMIYGYVRVSTSHQNVENGRFEIAKFAQKSGFAIDKWVIEQVSSTEGLSRRKLGALAKKLESGDILITTEISRLGRNLLEVMELLHYCLKTGCQVWTIKENYRLGQDIQSKVMAFAFGISAEIERNLISARTREALQRVKEEGKKLGRPPGKKKISPKLEPKTAEIQLLLKKGLKKREIARQMRVSPTTLHKHLKAG
jgi:DNA invertase Pin-like site-specific DNA recombinase